MDIASYWANLRRLLGPRAPVATVVTKLSPVLPRIVPKECPPLEASVVAWLDWAIPAYDPTPSATLPEIMFRGGQREVVNKLKAELARQQQRSKDL
jgi:hypothetical protein